MSYKQIRVCDGCGDDIKQHNAYKIKKVVLETENYTDAAGSRDYGLIQQEFCDDCAEKLLKTLDKVINFQSFQS